MGEDRRIVLDLETKYSFDEVGGRGNTHKLGVTVAVVYDYASATFKIYEEHELGQLENLLLDASLVIGFNHRKFDVPVLQPYMSTTLSQLPMFDLLESLQETLGYRIGLDNVAQATLGCGKTGHGLDAIEYYRTGRMEELKAYCQEDVRITRDVYEFGLKHGYIKIGSKDGRQTKKLTVDWAAKAVIATPLSIASEAQYRLF